MINLNEVNSAKDVITKLFDGKGTFIEIHKLRSVGPNLLNRDENGNAKTIEFGGATRTVVSSQCRKAAIRAHETEYKTFRTRYVGELVADTIADMYMDASTDYLRMADIVTQHVFEDVDEKNGRIKTVASVSNDDVMRIANKIVEHFPLNEESFYPYTKKKEFDAKNSDYDALCEDLRELKNSSMVDYEIAMFGRMSTNSIIRSVDSAAFYNFAYTTNPAAGDSDYFIAQDTFKSAFDEAEGKGAAHLNERDLCAGCYYSYAGIALTTYVENILESINFKDKAQLKERLKKSVDYLLGVIEKTIMVMPSAMQHQMASYPDPDCVYVVLKRGVQNMTYDKAFEKPVYSDRTKSVAEKSVERLVNEVNNSKFDTAKYLKRYWIGADDMTPNDTVSTTLKDMLEDMKEYFYEQIGLED